MLIAVCALAVQLVFLVEGRSDPTFDVPIIDAEVYHEAAARFAQGDRLIDDAFWQPPLFPLLLGLLYRAIGPNIVAAKIALALLAAGSCLLVWWIGRCVWSSRVGIIAALALALYGPFVFFSTQLLPAGLAIFLILLSLAFWLSCLRHSRWYRWLLFGFSSGLAVITVPNAAVLIVLGGAGILFGILTCVKSSESRGLTPAAQENAQPSAAQRFRHSNKNTMSDAQVSLPHGLPLERSEGGRGSVLSERPGTGGAIGAALSLLIGAAIPICATTARNYAVAGEWVLISTNGGINLYVGNNPESERTVAIRPGEPWQRFARQACEAGAATRAEQSRFFFRRALQYCTTELIDCAKGMFRKLILLLNAREIPRNVDLYVHRDYSTLLGVLVWRAGPFAFPFGLLAPLGALGIVLWFGSRSQADFQLHGTLMLLAFLLTYGASIVLFFVSARYRLPVVPVMILFAAYAVDRVWDRWRNRRYDPLSRKHMAIAVVVPWIVLVAPNWPIAARTDGVNFRAELAMSVGSACLHRGDYNEAEMFLREAKQLEPGNPQIIARLAALELRRGRAKDAEEFLRAAQAQYGESVEVLLAFGAALHAQEKYAQAEEVFQRALMRDPGSPGAHAALAALLADTARYDEAIDRYREALRCIAEPGPVQLGLADALVANADDMIAGRESGRALLTPEAPDETKLIALASTERLYAEAIEYYKLALRQIEPDDAVLNRVAWLLATCPVPELRDCRQAIEIAEYLCDRTGYRHAVALDTLAAAYAECGRFDEAIRWAERAIEIAADQGRADVVDSVRTRLEIYLKAGESDEPPFPSEPTR